MKKLVLLIISIACASVGNNLIAQVKIREGKIKFSVTFPNIKPDASFLARMPKEKIVYFKNGNTRIESKTEMGSAIKFYFSKTGESYTCIERKGQKIAMKTTKEELKAFKEKMGMVKPVIKITGETKNIAGIRCKKATVTYNNRDEKRVIDAWFTNEILAPNPSDQSIEGINGFLMQYTMTDENESMLITCTSVETIKIPGSYFKIPEGYTMKTMDEMMRERMGR